MQFFVGLGGTSPNNPPCIASQASSARVVVENARAHYKERMAARATGLMVLQNCALAAPPYFDRTALGDATR